MNFTHSGSEKGLSFVIHGLIPSEGKQFFFYKMPRPPSLLFNRWWPLTSVSDEVTSEWSNAAKPPHAV